MFKLTAIFFKKSKRNKEGLLTVRNKDDLDSEIRQKSVALDRCPFIPYTYSKT